MFQRKINTDKRADKILKNEDSLNVSGHSSKIMLEPAEQDSSVNAWVTYDRTLKELIAKAQAKQKAIVFTVVSGPFRKCETLPEDWMKTPSVVGCTAQLTAFEQALKEKTLDADVYAINKHKSYEQLMWLVEKQFSELSMLDDSKNKLKEIFDLKEIEVNGNKYDLRETIVVKPNNEVGFFKIASPVTAEIAEQHIEEIKKFIAPQLVSEFKLN